VKKALKSLPKTLDERILMNINEEHRQKALVALQWISHAGEPITLNELAEAVIIDETADPSFNPNDRIPDPLWLVEILSGLVIFSEHKRNWTIQHLMFLDGKGSFYSTIEIAHFSVKEFLNSGRIRSGPACFFCISEQRAIEAIVQRSLLYIICYSVSDRKMASSIDLNEFPLLLFACRF
jgi:hypothetical protein